jgi:hypothetical protein
MVRLFHIWTIRYRQNADLDTMKKAHTKFWQLCQ